MIEALKPKSVYVAGPLTLGPAWLNCRRAIDVANKLMEHGFVPFVPHLSMFFDMVHEHPHEVWVEQDLYWIGKCDAVMWLDGMSVGTNRELEYARKIGKLVYPADDIDNFIKAYARTDSL